MTSFYKIENTIFVQETIKIEQRVWMKQRIPISIIKIREEICEVFQIKKSRNNENDKQNIRLWEN